MSCAFDCGGETPLVFEAGACDATGKDFALLVNEANQEIRVFVVDVTNTRFFEATILFASDGWLRQECIGGSCAHVASVVIAPIILNSHSCRSVLGLGVLILRFSRTLGTAAVVVGHGVFV